MPHIECVKNNGKPYLRLAESRYIKDIGRQKKFVIKNLGPLSKFDDGKPDFLTRFREKFKNGTCLISTPDNEIEKIVNSLGIEMPDLTTIDKIDKFKNILNKDIFM